ncbi:MAG: ABC transporter ATP-binding protein [Geminicoccaceae bacterium]|nr:ABC transporter ATP-binding protein [Geminicoccaceae bacterium]HRY23138.1 ABC transporter ATP-binding protein [Geminicoccaceae bacterium]
MSERLLTVEGLSVDLVRDGGLVPVLRDVSLALEGRQVLGIVGESGSGKTVLAKALVGWVAEPLVASRGVVRFRGQDLLAMPPEARRILRGSAVGYIGADPGSSFDPTLPVGRQIVEKVQAVRADIDARAAKKRVLDLLDRVHIPSAARRFDEFPHQYSGGMLQRAMIVDALASDPAFLVCDNITQPLDVTVAAQIMRLLHELRSDLDAGIVFISTSLPVVCDIADELVVLSRGEIVERSTPARLLEAPAHPYSQDLIARNPIIWGTPPLPVPAEASPRVILAVDDVTKTYVVPDRTRFFGTQAVKAVRGVSFAVHGGENLGLVGESGCGKSTLSRLLSWVEQPDQGRIRFKGQDIAGMSAQQLLAMRKGFQLLLQDPFNCLPPNLPIGRSVAMSLQIHGGLGRKAIAEQVRAVMAEVGLKEDDRERLPIGMSAGQRQRVNIARALILEPELLILDETLSALDPMEQARLLDLFERLQARHGFTYLFISHDLAMVRRVCTRIAVMYLGKVVELADTRSVFFEPTHPYTRALLSAVPTLEEKPFKAADCLLEGEPPSPIDLPQGCSFAARCPHAMPRCRVEEPPLVDLGGGRFSACWLNEPEVSRAA